MSFLAPLYALAALAIAAPIVFHFFQRRPYGQRDFSSLMFLRPSPPQLTRRHHLSNLLLLLLRGLALLLLAAAFARPFLRSSTLLDLDVPARGVAVVIDTSASMRRDGLWDRARQMADQAIQGLRPTDRASLIAFDQRMNTLLSFEAWQEADPSKRIPMLREQLAGLRPSWHATQLGSALIAASDALLQQRMVDGHDHPLQIVLISDFQAGSDLESLQSYQWPEEVAVDLRAVAARQTTNASLRSAPAAAGDLDAAQVRVLVRNEPDSKSGQFSLAWETPDSGLAPISVHVPPGQTRVVRVTQPAGTQALKIMGDEHAFDNTLYLAESAPQRKELLFVGPPEEGRESLFFYLRQASLDTRAQRVAIRQEPDSAALATLDPREVPLLVLARPLEDTAAADLRGYVQRGGRLLVVIEQRRANAEMATFLRDLLELPDLLIEEAETSDYAMLARIDFEHPLFAPFVDPRFSDFTKIRFWKRRRLMCSHEEPWSILARFDDQLPALVEKPMQDGFVWILTSGWQPAESQLALSWKFIPLLLGMVGQPGNSRLRDMQATVGQALPLPPSSKSPAVIGPSNQLLALSTTDAADTWVAEEPGIYQIQSDLEPYFVAVNLAAEESRTEPLTPDRLEQLGIRLGQQESVEALRERQRQMRNVELESRQKLWRWGILAALGAVLAETWLGGRAGRAVEVETT